MQTDLTKYPSPPKTYHRAFDALLGVKGSTQMKLSVDDLKILDSRDHTPADIADPAVRRGYIGASDAAAVLNKSPWVSRYALYLQKVGELDGESGNQEAMYWGTVQEENVARAFAEKAGLKLRRTSKLYRHHKNQFIACHPDRLIVGHRAALECKTQGEWGADQWGDELTDQIPEHYKPQIWQYFATMPKIEDVFVAALIGGNKHRIYRMTRWSCVDEVAALVDAEVIFWGQVQKRTPPIPETIPECALAYPDDIETVPPVEATPELIGVLDRLIYHREQLALTNASIDKRVVDVKNAMGDAGEIILGDLTLATWQTDKKGSRRFVVKDKNIRRLING